MNRIIRIMAALALVCGFSMEPLRPYLPESGAAPQAELLEHSGKTSFSNRNDMFRFEEEEPGESSSIGANAAMRSIPQGDDEMPAAMMAGAVLEPDAELVEKLACAIYSEAGGDECSDECRINVGDVILNRVKDPRFPNTIEGVLTAPRQYGTFSQTGVVWPARASVDGRSYHVIGLGELGKSPVKYCPASIWAAKEHEIGKFLHVAHVYPRQVEMLMKAGMADVVFDLAIRGVKHCAVLDWRAEELKRAWKVPPEIVREFLRTQGPKERDIRKLETWKTLNRKKKVSFREVMEAWPLLSNSIDMKFVKKWGEDPLRLHRYLERQNARFYVWRDYVEAGQKIGLNIYRDDVLLPGNLAEAHDAAVAERNRRAQAELARQREERKRQAAEERKRAEAAAKGYDKYREKLEKRYGWEAGKYRITVPESKEAIEREGRELKHCVGGYADRHIQGKTVILFMRKISHPDTPWITIEMNGAELVQIHGYRNEGAYSAKRIAPDPREVYREWLDPWLDWVKAGSRRKKDGTPIVPKNKKEAVA